MVSSSILVIALVCLISVGSCFEYKENYGFHLHNGENLSAHSLEREVEADFNVNWKIYEFFTVSFTGFALDSTLTMDLSNDHSHRIFEKIPVAEGEYQIKLAGVLPGENYKLVLTGDQSGHIASMDHISIEKPDFQRLF